MTFDVSINSQLLPGGSVWLDLFWPLFGLGVSAGALMTLRMPTHWDRRHLLLRRFQHLRFRRLHQ